MSGKASGRALLQRHPRSPGMSHAPHAYEMACSCIPKCALARRLLQSRAAAVQWVADSWGGYREQAGAIKLPQARSSFADRGPGRTGWLTWAGSLDLRRCVPCGKPVPVKSMNQLFEGHRAGLAQLLYIFCDYRLSLSAHSRPQRWHPTAEPRPASATTAASLPARLSRVRCFPIAATRSGGSAFLHPL